MESPTLAHLFRQLFSHQMCCRLRFRPWLSNDNPFNKPGRRHYQSSSNDVPEDGDRQTSNWQQRTDIFPPDKLRDYEKYPFVTSDTLRARRERPKRVKMLTRDFIEGMWAHYAPRSFNDTV